MNSKQLNYFLTTSESGSIAAAARVLDVAQPAISLQIANLEHELKVQLFTRDFRGVQLTQIGEQFRHYAMQIIDLIDTAKAEISNNQSSYSGNVVVGLSQSICNVLSVELFAELEHRFANVEVTFRIGPSNIVEQWLEDNAVDIAFVMADKAGIEPRTAEYLLPLIREDLFLYIANKPQNPAYSELDFYHSIPFKDLQHYDILMPDKHDALSKLMTNTALQAGIKLKPKKAFGQMMTNLHFVSQGLGLMVCPSSSTYQLENNNQIRPIKIIQPPLQRIIYLQKSQLKQTDPTVDVVFELIREITATLNANNHWKGIMIDNKYGIPAINNIATLIEC